MKTIAKSKTIRQILQEGTEYLISKKKDNARGEAEQLIAFGLGIDRINIYLNLDKPLSDSELQNLRSLFIARAAGKPLQYILGESSFRYLSLKVDESVLIPRQETELIIDVIAEKIKEDSKILELGTGSGAIAISLAKELALNVDATDISSSAVEVAKKNAQVNKVENINWIQSSWFENIEGKYDLIISNPPYVGLEEYQSLAVEITDHEPAEAVTDGADGLQYIKHIINEAPKYLNPAGNLVLEIGAGQRKPVQSLMQKADFKQLSFEKDLAGIDRFAVAQFLSS